MSFSMQLQTEFIGSCVVFLPFQILQTSSTVKQMCVFTCVRVCTFVCLWVGVGVCACVFVCVNLKVLTSVVMMC